MTSRSARWGGNEGGVGPDLRVHWPTSGLGGACTTRGGVPLGAQGWAGPAWAQAAGWRTCPSGLPPLCSQTETLGLAKPGEPLAFLLS